MECPVCSLRHSPRCTRNGPTWPLAPLLDQFVPYAGVSALADRLSVNPCRLIELAEVGLTDDMADRWAVRLGLHPSLVWPDWFDAGLTVVDAQFVESGWRQVFDWTEPAAEVAA